MEKIIKKSFLASLCLSLGCCINIKCISAGVPWLGALAFGLGLYTIVHQKYFLYTGMISKLYSKHEDLFPLKSLCLILFFNLLFGYLIGLCFYTLTDQSVVHSIIISKLNENWYEIIFKGIFCGVCLHLAIYSKSDISLFGFIFIFVFCGFEHCIANTIYFAMDFKFPWWFILLNVACNSYGSLLVAMNGKRL